MRSMSFRTALHVATQYLGSTIHQGLDGFVFVQGLWVLSGVGFKTLLQNILQGGVHAGKDTHFFPSVL